jgi:hypothetical protein
MTFWRDPPPRRPHLERLGVVARWHLEHRRARRALYYADLEYRRQETPDRLARRIRASEHLRRLEWNRP